MRLALAFLAAVLPLAAHAQTVNPAPIPTGAPGIVIPAQNTRGSIRYQVQGTGWACLSWQVSTPTITGSTAAATCGGAGSFLVTAGSADNRIYPGPINSLPLYAVGAAGSSLQISYEVQ